MNVLRNDFISDRVRGICDKNLKDKRSQIIKIICPTFFEIDSKDRKAS